MFGQKTKVNRPEVSEERCWDGDVVGSTRCAHNPGCDSTCSVWMCNFGFSLSLYHPYLFALFLKISKGKKKKKSQEINSPKQSRWVIGSYVDARAVWPQQDKLAVSSEPG